MIDEAARPSACGGMPLKNVETWDKDFLLIKTLNSFELYPTSNQVQLDVQHSPSASLAQGCSTLLLTIPKQRPGRDLNNHRRSASAQRTTRRALHSTG